MGLAILAEWQTTKYQRSSYTVKSTILTEMFLNTSSFGDKFKYNLNRFTP